jgi:hypothetical protein
MGLEEVSSLDRWFRVDMICPISIILTTYAPRKPPESKWAYSLSIGSVNSQGDEGIHIT